METRKKKQTDQSTLWLGHVNRQHIFNGSLDQYIARGMVQGLFFSPQAMGRAICSTHVYDDGIMWLLSQGMYGKPLLLDLLLADIEYAADLLYPVFEQSKGVDGWAVLPVSPLLTSHPDALVASATQLIERIAKKNILLSIPGFGDLAGAIEEIAFRGLPFKISLVFSREQFCSVARAYLRGIERRITAGLNPWVAAFVSVPFSRMLAMLTDEMSREDASRISAAVLLQIYQAMNDLQTTRPWITVFNDSAQPLRLVCCLLEDEPDAFPDTALYNNCKAFCATTVIPEVFMAKDAGQNFISAAPATTSEKLSDSLEMEGADFDQLGSRLQEEEAKRQISFWINLLDDIARKSADLIQTRSRTNSKTHK